MAIKTPQGSIVDIPRGTRDFGTAESIALKEVTSVIEEIFKRFGFSPIITPALETTEVLNAKAYGEQTKEMYVIEGGENALRFDLTVPLARYMAMNKGLQLPFKRYQIDRIWRKDEPQRMRSREFMQADVDIVGSSDPSSDAECIAASLVALEALGVRNYTLLINSRPILGHVLKAFKVPADKTAAAIKILDKLAKVGETEVSKQVQQLGMQQNDVDQLLAFITEDKINSEKLDKLAITAPESKPDVESLRSILNILDQYGLAGEIRVDFSLARGFDYYTGAIWEAVIVSDGKRLPSVLAGGRYDNLVGIYSKSPAPAVGSSIGITRVLEILNGAPERKTYAKVYVAQIGKENAEYALAITRIFREAGIYTDLSVTSKGISKQLEYSNFLGIRYVAIIGAKEKEAAKIKLRDMQAGTEELLDVTAAIAAIKK